MRTPNGQILCVRETWLRHPFADSRAVSFSPPIEPGFAVSMSSSAEQSLPAAVEVPSSLMERAKALASETLPRLAQLAAAPMPVTRRALSAPRAVVSADDEMAPPDDDRVDPRPRALIESNPALRTIYLLRTDLYAPARPHSPKSMEVFLLWYAVFGRKEYRNVQNFSVEYMDWLWERDGTEIPRILSFIVSIRPDVVRELGDRYALLGWFYCMGIVEYRLAPLIPSRELFRLAQPTDRPGEDQRLSLLMRYVHAFRVALGEDWTDFTRPEGREGFIDWYRSNAHRTYPVLRHLLPAGRPTTPGVQGVTIVGYHRGALGIGEDARCLMMALRHAGVPVSLIDLCHAKLEKVAEAAAFEAFEAEQPCFPLVVVCAPPFETARIRAEWGEGPFAGRTVIGYWPWELTELGRNWAHAYDLVDEIWVASRFLEGVFKAETEKPVHLMPMLVDVSQTRRVSLEPYGIAPGDFVFLAMFDFNSTITRKNPLGIIQAFRTAFPSREAGVKLLIKTTHAEQQAEAWSTVEEAIGEDERIIVIDGAMDRAEVCGLIAAVSCFVSLHRSEGFGRVLAEAMALVTPVIATDWSGSRDYLSQQTGFPVRCSLRRVQEDEYPQAAGSWAEPDVTDAAQHMRHLREQPSVASARVALGQRVIAAKYGIDAVSGAVLARLRDMAMERDEAPLEQAQ